MKEDLLDLLPPYLNETVEKLNLDCFSVKAPPPLPTNDPWDLAKSKIQAVLDEMLSETKKDNEQILKLTIENLELKEKLYKADNITRVFDIAFDEMFGVDTFPHVRTAFKSRLGI